MIIMWIRIKYALFNTEFIIVIATSNLKNFRNSTTKFILIDFYLAFSIDSRCGSLSNKH